MRGNLSKKVCADFLSGKKPSDKLIASKNNNCYQRRILLGGFDSLNLAGDLRMPRLLFSAEKIHPSIREKAEKFNRSIVEEVLAAVERDDIVVVGMAQNPVCKKARKFLDEKKLTYTYLEYGSYFKQWKRRLSLKMWVGWPTYPMVFVRGQFIGGFVDMEALDKSGEFQELLSA